MPDLRFEVESVLPAVNAVTPQLLFKVGVTNTEPGDIHSIALRVQVQVEPVRRRYSTSEQKRLKELFGEPERWSTSLHPLLWANVNVSVREFSGSTFIDVPVPCTFDFNVAITKYVYGLENGELPTTLLFSGTVFYAGRNGLQIAQIPWDRDASYRLPIQVWKEMMDLYYPQTAWICVPRELFDRLNEFRERLGLQTWEQALERLLSPTGVES